MTQAKTDLSKFNNSWYTPGGNFATRGIWYFINVIFFKSAFPFSRIKTLLLILFGAKIGKRVTIKPHISIKYPWNLSIGNDVWIGEQVWIDNLAKIDIGNHVCISQGALLLTGNHNYKSITFDLIIKPISLEDGAWIGAKSTVCQGVTVGSHAVLTVNSVASHDMAPYSIYKGNPAVKIKDRIIS